MKVICEHCKKQFEMKQEMLKERHIGAMHTETYYICPLCNHKYVVCIQSPKSREIKRQLDNKIAEVNTYINLGIRKIATPEDIKMLDKLKNDLIEEMDRINGKV